MMWIWEREESPGGPRRVLSIALVAFTRHVKESCRTQDALTGDAVIRDADAYARIRNVPSG